MSAIPQKKETINFKDLFTLHFLRALFKTVWLFFPAILFLLLALVAFWQLDQGKDLLVRTLENGRIFGLFIIAEVFWTYITWYTCYIISKIKLDRLPDNSTDKDELHLRRMLIQMPRFLAFSCLSVIMLAFYKLLLGENMNWLFFVILAISPFIYAFIYGFWSRQADKVDDDVKFPTKESKIKYLNKYRYTTLIIFAVALIVISFYHTTLLLMILLMIFQAGLVLLLVFKKKRFIISMPVTIVNEKDTLAAKVKKRLFGEEEKFYTRLFILILFFGLIFYISTIVSISISVMIGAVPFIIFAFGVLLILGNAVTFLSVHFRINLHGVAMIIAFIIGLFYEPHYTQLPAKKVSTNTFSNRQTLPDYFKNWINLRKTDLDSSSKEYPVYFVLADGGASRSGYWSASVMARLDSLTNGKLTSHLFCLSGASGGSLGNAAYFNLLRAKQTDSTANTNGVHIVEDYLETDFLTYTIARMLGPDVFRYVLPLWFVDDRAAALAAVMETGSGEKSSLYNSMSTGFSEIITQKNIPYRLPIICINTTRMQDGIPAVISNISINDIRFNKRVDLLSLLGEQRDIKMSQAVVLGASFPYLSPAGRIDYVRCDTCKPKPNYFVDGGYFDNSGSGVV
ncbi:MAG: patatin-like phospholipase family protein, partial [Ferruginibacter sp.]